MTQQDNEEFMTPNEAAQHVNLSRRQLERYVEQGKLKKYRRGITRSVFFKRSELDSLFAIHPDSENGNK